MVYEEILPHYLSIGVTWERFMDSCPKELEPFDRAHKRKLQEQDFLLWLANQYTLSAVMVAVERNLHGRKSKSKYIKNPFLQENENFESKNPESREEVAVFEMKQRINALREQGIPESPI